MTGFFYHLGRRLGPKMRQAAWMWQSAFGNEDERLAAESAVGKDLTTEVLNRMSPLGEETLEMAVSPILERLVRHLSDRRRSFRVYTVRADPPNAFALPGGSVVVTDSLLTLCEQDPDALAFVLGHEIAHVVKGHAMERLAVNSAISTVANLGKIRKSVVGWVRNVGVGALQGAYSREHELEADQLGARLMHAAGYRPEAACRLLERLPHGDSETSGLMSYFSSHPPMSQRIVEIRRIIADERKTGR